MKRLLVMVMALMLVWSAVAEGPGLTAPEFVDIDGIEDPAERAEAAISYFHKILYGSELDHVTINPNYGTDDPGDAIALVYMNYTDMHDTMPSIDMDVAVRVSNTIAMAIEGDCPEVVELTIFWRFAEYNADGKITFTIDDEGTHYGDAMFPAIMAN